MAEMTPIRLGLIGCGTYARQTHLTLALEMKGLEVSAVWNRGRANLGQALTQCEQAGVQLTPVDDWRKLIVRTDVDAVITTLPPALNADVLEACERAGKPVLIEKPVAANERDLERIEQLLEREQIDVQVGTQVLHSDWFHAIHEAVTDLGAVLCVDAQCYMDDAWAFDDMTWKVSPETSGGMLNSWGVHPVTLVMSVAAGSARKIDYAELSAFTGSGYDREGVDPRMYDIVQLSWLTEAGGADVPCQLAVTMAPEVQQPRWRLAVMCEGGRIEADFLDHRVDVMPRGQTRRGVDVGNAPEVGFDGNRQQLERFASAIRAGGVDDRTTPLAVLACHMALEINVDPTA